MLHEVMKLPRDVPELVRRQAPDPTLVETLEDLANGCSDDYYLFDKGGLLSYSTVDYPPQLAAEYFLGT